VGVVVAAAAAGQGAGGATFVGVALAGQGAWGACRAQGGSSSTQ
jgi:hypothetical protein